MIKRYTLLFPSLVLFSLGACSQPPPAAPAPPAPTATLETVATFDPPPTATATPLPTATLLPSVTPVPTATSDAPLIPRYGIFEQAFHWPSSAYSNPWEQVQLTLTLTAPSGKEITIGGFYYGPDTWRARFAPDETGPWTWQAIIEDGAKTETSTGVFTVVNSDWPGFVRQNPDNPFRWVFDDGSPYYPLGIGDCVLDYDHSGTPLDNWGFDGDFRNATIPIYGWVTDFDTYWRAYSEAGVNLFRWSVDNCAFKLYRRIDPTGNVYRAREGIWGDELVQQLQGYNVRVFMTLFGFTPPFPTADQDPAQLAAIERYVKYVVDRYGAYVDFWELMNEAPQPGIAIDDAWYEAIGSYLHSVDPYHHPLSTSWPKPGLSVIDIAAPHWYENEDELQSDVRTRQQIDDWKSYGKPIIFTEQGNSEQNWDARSAVRMRLRTWAAFFNEGSIIFWNSTFVKDYRAHGASNIYLGPEERGYLKVLQDFTRGFDAHAKITTLSLSNPAHVRGYALRAPATYAAYLVASNDHSQPLTNIKVTIQIETAGVAQWISPATGEVLGTQVVTAGTQTLAAPSFITDVALKIAEP